MSNLKKLYDEKIIKQLTDEFKYKTPMEAPKLNKIVVNMGVGEAAHDEKFIEAATKDLEAITGQKPIITKARKSIAGFKLREGNVECKNKTKKMLKKNKQQILQCQEDHPHKKSIHYQERRTFSFLFYSVNEVGVRFS